ncbi:MULTISPECIES: hypothetical protein [unclassified Microcoleus]|uniref:hypothetical protein n=1 Tax=unclassified Microcoleus TaxID=2642155 RepID=UPI002FD2F5F5
MKIYNPLVITGAIDGSSDRVAIYSRFHVYEVHPRSLFECRRDTALPCPYLC